MFTILLSLLLAVQIMLSGAALLPPSAEELRFVQTQTQPRMQPLMWGMLDPELSAWFARIPGDEEAAQPIQWNWSWRGFWAALFGQPMLKEAAANAPSI